MGDAPTAPAPAREAIDGLRSAMGEMLQAERRLRARDHQRPGQLSYSQARTIAALGRCPETTPGKIAKQAGLTPASVTAVLDQLEAQGLVQRRRCAEDRRVKFASLTPRGRELLDAKLAHWQAMWQDWLEDFSESEVDAARRVLERIGGIFDTLAAGDDSSRPAASHSNASAWGNPT